MEKKSITLRELAQQTDSELIGDPEYLVTGCAGLDTATESDVSFFLILSTKDISKQVVPERFLYQPTVTIYRRKTF